MFGRAQKSWKWIAIAALALALYFWATRKRVIGTVDISGEGMTVNGV